MAQNPTGHQSPRPLAPHDLSLDVRIAIVLTSDIMPVLTNRFMRRQFREPGFIVLMQTALIIIDEDRGGDMHRIHERQPFPNAALFQAHLNVSSDIDKRPPRMADPGYLMTIIASNPSPEFL